MAAGELEIIFKILLALCYRWEYLEVNDLRDGYDSIMKEIEQGRRMEKAQGGGDVENPTIVSINSGILFGKTKWLGSRGPQII